MAHENVALMLAHGLEALASPACLVAFVVYAVLTAFLPVLNRWARVGDFLTSCVLTLGTPALTIFLSLSAARAMLPLKGASGGGIHPGAGEIVALLALALVLCLALAAIEFTDIDTRGLPTYLVGLVTVKLFFDANAPHAPLFPNWLATIGIFALVAFVAILLALVANEEAADIATAAKREPTRARATVKQCLTPALNFIPAILGVCLYGSAVGVR